MSPSSNHLFVHNFMRLIGVKISTHITNFTLIVIHVPFADKSKFYVIFVLYFVVYVTIGNLYYFNTLFMYGFWCPPPLQSLFLAICTHFTSYSFMSRHTSPILIYFSPTSSSSSMLHMSPKRIIDAWPKCNEVEWIQGAGPHIVFWEC